MSMETSANHVSAASALALEAANVLAADVRHRTNTAYQQLCYAADNLPEGSTGRQLVQFTLGVLNNMTTLERQLRELSDQGAEYAVGLRNPS